MNGLLGLSTRGKQEQTRANKRANKRTSSYFGLFNFEIKLKRANKQETGTPQRNRILRAKMSTEALLNNVLRLEQELATALKSLKLAVGMDQIAEKLEQEPKQEVKPKKQKKDPDAPKREPNAWIRFTMRLSELLKANGISLAVVQQKSFASVLNKQKAGGVELASLSDEFILTELKAWTPPPLKVRSSASAEASSSESASESGAEGKEKKARKPQSEETKAVAAIKRAATKAANAAGKEQPKLSFEPWSYVGEDCWQNERGDSLNPEGEWMGRFLKGKFTMKSKSEMPGDLEPFIYELMKDE
jgi:hypothetical protein